MGFFPSAVTTRFESLRYQVIFSWQQTYAIFVFDARPLADDKAGSRPMRFFVFDARPLADNKSVKGFLLQKKEVIF